MERIAVDDVVAATYEFAAGEEHTRCSA
jgi:hypothetical protein